MFLVVKKQPIREIAIEVPAATELWPVKSIGGLLKIPAPRTGNWAKSFGSWKGFTVEIHRSIGKNLGSGVLKLSRTTSPRRIKASV